MIKLPIAHSDINLLAIDPFIGRLLSLKVAGMLLIGVDALNGSNVLGHIGRLNPFIVRVMNKVAVVSPVASRGRMVVNAGNCFLLQIFMDLILGQKTTLICWLIIPSHQGPLGHQGLRLSIVKLQPELVELLNGLMRHFQVLFHLGNIGGILVDHI